METLFGLSGATKLYYCFETAKRLKRPLLYITYNEIERAKAYGDLCAFDDPVTFEATGIQFLENDIRQNSPERVNGLMGAVNGKSVVVSVDGIMSFLAPKKEFERSILKLETSMSMEIEDLKKELIALGYERHELAESSDSFAVRGDIVDIGCGYRVEFFDTEITAIKRLDTETQLSMEPLEQITVGPATVMPVLSMDKLYGAFKEEYDRCQRSMAASDAKMEARLERCLASMEKGVPFGDMCNFGYYAFDKPASIADYMDNPLIVFDDCEKVLERVETVKNNYLEKFTSHFKKGQALRFHDRCLNFGLAEEISENAVNLKEFPESPHDKVINTKSIIYKPSMGEEFFKFIKNGYDYKTYIFCGSKNRAERFSEMLRERDIGSFYRDTFEDMEAGRICVLPLGLSGSVEYVDRKIRFISDQIKQKKKQKQRSSKTDVFADINVGDYVVHDVYGIGRYIGIETVTSLKKTRDYLAIEYRDGDMLRLPTERMDRLQKYIGSSDAPPRLSKIGGKEWKKVKERVSKNVEDMAEDLVRLYARRASKKGYAFSQDTPWQKEFEESFEFEDTPDQITSTAEIKGDMENGVIMDRLLCGDVGYGKTEVAIRAMFKCVMDGKQAVLMAPTVVLAKQHYLTLTERLRGYPIRIGMLSRFSSPKEIKETLSALEKGETDIIIGTHKLLGKRVKYKDLGLLVIDEEQRFGVRHKEQLKLLKNTVDVLSLSATPIPRTLYMSLIGVRDISVIETPPLQRQTVATYVMEYNDDLAVDAVNDEISRGGQVYFLYNNVANIDKFAYELSLRLPGVTVDVGHGQMNKDDLEKVMLDFYSGDTQVLICSTIIESGLDVTNANTIIVYDADRFGLSQLYQLRGRVGRGKEQAYAYFTYRNGLTEKAHKRLSAIKDFTEFGSGFKIAMRDLEIRGAGNIMGSAQSGNMAAVGYDMYCRLIQSAVNKIRGTEEEQDFETTVKMRLDAFIPDNYINNEDIKIDVYKRISDVTSDESADILIRELTDRFGRPPEPVLRLVDVAKIKAMCQRAKIAVAEQTNDGVGFKLGDGCVVDNQRLIDLTGDYDLHFGQDGKIILKIKDANEKQMMNIVLTFLEKAFFG